MAVSEVDDEFGPKSLPTNCPLNMLALGYISVCTPWLIKNARNWNSLFALALKGISLLNRLNLLASDAGVPLLV